jgi:hypothetical protein
MEVAVDMVGGNARIEKFRIQLNPPCRRTASHVLLYYSIAG